MDGIFFKEIEINRSAADWLICFVKNNQFEGRGGVDNLSEILNTFRDWAEKYG